MYHYKEFYEVLWTKIIIRHILNVVTKPPKYISFFFQRNPREQFRSKVNLMSYIAQHRTSLNPKKVDLYEEINFYRYTQYYFYYGTSTVTV